MINKFGFYDALEDCFDPSILTYFEANTAGQRVKSRTFSRCALGYDNMGCQDSKGGIQLRECVRAGAAGSRTPRSSGDHILNPQNFCLNPQNFLPD